MHKIKVSDEVNFIFRINETVLLNIDINLATKRSHVNYHVDEDELRPILNKNEWSYNGIENRLNWWFNQDKSLAHYAMSIYKDEETPVCWTEKVQHTGVSSNHTIRDDFTSFL